LPALCVLAAACASGAGSWPQADAAFQSDARWLGGDACYSIDLGGGRILWLFGDSFVARGARRDRRDAAMVRNTIAIQHGRDPARASIAFHCGRAADGAPAPFFAGEGELGCWPLHGVRLAEGPLVMFQTLVRNTPGEGLGFALAGWRVVRVADPDDPPARWRATVLAAPELPFPSMVGTAVWRDGAHVVALGTNGEAPHDGLLFRFAAADLLAGRVSPSWWNGSTWTAAGAPTVVLREAGPECSLHFDVRRHRWLHVVSRGFGATTIVRREAPAPTGPWSVPVDVFTPPESRAPRPFVYAAKAHPELDGGAGCLVLTYAANAWNFAELFTERGQRELYWPRFVRMK
jgi:hypothetical protein